MSSPRPLVGTTVVRPAAFPPVASQWTARQDRRPSQPPAVVPYTRRYEVRWLDARGEVEDFVRVAPAMPIFEAGFSAFAHGALIATAEGPVAVEDLEPGMRIETAAGRTALLRWIGSITLVPNAPTRGRMPDRLYRVVAESLGLGRPASDVTFGPAARLLDRTPEACRSLGSEAALVPVRAYADGVSVAEITPVSAVRVYHLNFDAHHVIFANGLEVESFHPGPDAAYSLSDEMRAQFLALFPHKERLQDFGRMVSPRVEMTPDDAA